MPVVARRFKIEIAGMQMHGIACTSEADLDAWLAQRGALLIDGAAADPTVRARRSARIASTQLATATPPHGPGRPRINDADALAEVRALVRQGLDQPAAIRTVAATMAGAVDAVSRRLRRKLGQNPG